jgi:nucleotide-binding universal stress UspA family protein
MNDEAIERYVKAWREYERQGIERLQAYAERAKAGNVKVEILQNYGDTGPLICEAAKIWSAEAILIGRRDRDSMLSEALLGSTSNYVLHHAACSMMVIQLTTRCN